MPKVTAKNASLENPLPDDLLTLSKEVNEATGKLLETTSTMVSFMRSLQTSGFREYVDYMARPWYTFWMNFLYGIARGLGFFIGATVVVGIVVWIISRVLTQLPFVGEFFETLQQFFSEENLKNLQSGSFLESAAKMFDAFKTNVLESFQQGQINP